MSGRSARTAGKGRWRIAAAAAVMTLCATAVAVGHAAVTGAQVLKVRLGGDQAQTRIVIDLDHAVSGKVISDGASGDRRLVLVLPGVSADQEMQGTGQGLVKAWLVDQTNGGARLQMDLAADAHIKGRFLLPPADGVDHYRYVLDVAAGAGAPVATDATPVKDAVFTSLKLTPKAMPVARKLSLKKVIVIDAGHGGHDPGARGAVSNEKDLNLAAALALKARLERTGRYKVVMTRDSDVYVPLEDRVRIAQRADADLFISLHSDSGADPSISGASVYTISDKAASTRAARFVTKDDWFMKASLAGGGVSDILFDLTQRATRNRSGAFAQTLITHVQSQVPVLPRSQRDAGYMVLLAPNVPAVLLEMGFITNAHDEQQLGDPGRRGRYMDAVADSIDDYFAESARLASR